MAWCRQATSHCWSRSMSPYHTVSLSTFKSAWKWQIIAFDTLTCMILIFSQTQPRIWGIVPTNSFCLSNTVVSRFTDTEKKMLQHTRREEESTVIALYFDKNALSWFWSVCVTANISCVFGRPLQHAHYIPRLKWKGSHVDYFVVTDCTPQVHSQKTAQIAKFHGANMGPTWVLSAPDGPYVGPMNLAIREPIPCPGVRAVRRLLFRLVSLWHDHLFAKHSQIWWPSWRRIYDVFVSLLWYLCAVYIKLSWCMQISLHTKIY